MKIAAAYIRVSTDDQVELSPDSQRKLIREYAKNHDMTVPDEFVFADEGISGKETTKRIAFNKMIGTAKLKPKPFDCILVWKFSRFARSREDSILYKSMLRKQLQIDVVSISENIGDDKMSILVEALIEAMDEYYSINLAEEVKRGMIEKATRGGAVTAPAFGYDIIDKKYCINKNEAPFVQMLFEKFANGVGSRELAQKMNSDKVKTKRGGLWENRTIDYILRNPVYIGKIRWNPNKKTCRNYDDSAIIQSAGLHQPIIDLPLWNEVQTKIAINKRIYGSYCRQEFFDEYMLHGLIKCDCCGSALTRTSKIGLQCHEYAKGKCAVSHYVSLDIANEIILSALKEMLIGGEFNISHKAAASSAINEVQMKISSEYDKLSRVKQAYEAGIDTLDEYKMNKKRIQQQIHFLEQKANPKQAADAKVIDKAIDSKKQLMPKPMQALGLLCRADLDGKEKNVLLRSFVESILFCRSASSFQIFLY